MSTHDLLAFTSQMPWFGWIALAGILSGTVTSLAGLRCKHAERIEMIRQGMNPDGGKPAPVEEEV